MAFNIEHRRNPKKRTDVKNIVPTFFIGLGGTGNNTLMYLRKKFYETGVMDAKQEFVRYLMIDTDSCWWPKNAKQEEYLPVRPGADERIECEITENQFTSTFDALTMANDPLYADWLKPDLRDLGPQAVIDGSGTWRPFGRMAFMLHYNEIRTQVETHLRDLVAAAARGGGDGMEVEPSHLEIVIVTSFAGGTGAGMYTDMAYLVKHIRNTMRETRELAHKYTTLIGLLPQAFERVTDSTRFEKFKRNGYACLLELEHFGTPRTGDELFLGQVESRSQLGTGFQAPWLDRSNRFIEGAGWEACYLIDNANALTQTDPLSLEETCRMVSDYLYLDFQDSNFAVEKRSNRSNLRQYQEDSIEVQVRSQNSSSESGLMQETDVVYAAQNGCTYSSFGLSKISFNLDRVYRAASYLLAEELIRQRWRGTDKSPDSTYEAWAKSDLYAPQPTTELRDPPSFSVEKLAERLYQTDDGKSWMTAAKREFGDAGSVAPEEGYDHLFKLHRKHDHAVSDNGPALRNVLERTNVLEGTPQDLGPLRTRLRAQMQARVGELGLQPTLRLVDYYEDQLSQVVDNAQRLMDNSSSASQVLLRLEEAGRVPFPGRRTAQRIEFPIATEDSTKYNLLRYQRGAAPSARALSLSAMQFLGDRSSPLAVPDDLQRHGTVREFLASALKQLDALTGRLVDRFSEHVAERGSHRSQALVPWKEQAPYIELVRRAMINFAPMKTPEGSGIDWHKVEREIFNNLNSDADSVWNLVEDWRRRRQLNDAAIAEFAEKLAGACRELLHKAQIDLSEFHQGSVVDILMLNSDTQASRTELLRHLINHSAPHFPLDIQGQGGMTKNYRPVFDCLLGLEKGEIPSTSEVNEEQLFDELKEKTQRANTANLDGVPKAIPSKDTHALVLSREVWGVPLQYYSSLGDLYDAYEKAGQEKPKLHLSWRQTWEDLPDVRAIKPETYEQIALNVENVLFAIILGKITCREDGAYEIRVPSPVAGVDTFKLGTRIGRIIKKACEEKGIRDHLREDLQDWETSAAPKNWAAAYASALATFEDVKTDIEHEADKYSPPVRNCFVELIQKFTRKLKTTDEGERWLQYLQLPTDEKSKTADEIAEIRQRHKQLREDGVIFRASPYVPVYEIDESQLDKMQLPQSQQGAEPSEAT